jgi:16S rRNA (guanine966-N2)-methyltransferase
VRIISGKWKGRKLHFPDNAQIRPTLGRARITLFNWLAGHIEDCRCLDLFAGSGALGLEAHSRGAASTTLVDTDPRTVASLREHGARLQAEGLEVVRSDALRFLRTTSGSWDLVFLDPPYESNLLLPTLSILQGRLAEGALVFCETSDPLTAPSGFLRLKQTRVGESHLALLQLARTA